MRRPPSSWRVFGEVVDREVRALTSDARYTRSMSSSSSAERRRLEGSARREANWQRFGAYLSERQWGTVREDYSDDGSGSTKPSERYTCFSGAAAASDPYRAPSAARKPARARRAP
jgi:hypothetical protein